MAACRENISDLLAGIPGRTSRHDGGARDGEFNHQGADFHLAIVFAGASQHATTARRRLDACPRDVLLSGVRDLSRAADSNPDRSYRMGV